MDIFPLGIAAFTLLVYNVAHGNIGDSLPTTEELENPKSFLASEVYTSDQVLLGKFYAENRSPIRYDQLSPFLIDALIATEDYRFKEHSGVDIWGLFRVLFKTVIAGQNTGGGSTISQQLAKNLFKRKKFGSIDEIVVRKIQEWVMATEIEKNYTKQEIIAMYFNTVEFGYNSFGIKTASNVYFNKNPDSLQLQEAAVLVGMLKGPSLFNPKRNPDTTRHRRNIVLYQMHEFGDLDKKIADSLKQLPIELDFQKADHNEGIATYFRQQLRLELRNWANTYTKVDGSKYDIYRDGLKIYTTIHSKMQEHAEAAVDTHMRYIQGKFFKHWEGRKRAPFDWRVSDKQIASIMMQGVKRSDRYLNMKRDSVPYDSIMASFEDSIKMTVFTWNGEVDTTMTPMDSILYYKYFLEAGFAVLEPQTGYIRAWVGGINHKYFKYDHVNINSKRQVGSTFKPFVYSVAIEEGVSPCKEYPNTPITFEKGKFGLMKAWTPKNSDGKYGGMVTLQEGLAESMNTITARLMYEIGPKPVVQMAHRLGIQSNVDVQPSIALGTPDISVYEMIGAYSVFVNKGVYNKPTFITRIEDKNGNIIEEFISEPKEVIHENTAYIMLNLLQNVVNHGTGVGMRFRYKHYGDMGGKTGTTQNHSDGWFMCVTPQLVMGAWVGNQDRSVHFRDLQYGQGARLAMPIVAHFLTASYADKSLAIDPKAKFDDAPEGLDMELDCGKHKKSTSLDQWGDI